MKLSIIIPVYNEINTIDMILQKIKDTEIPYTLPAGFSCTPFAYSIIFRQEFFYDAFFNINLGPLQPLVYI